MRRRDMGGATEVSCGLKMAGQLHSRKAAGVSLTSTVARISEMHQRAEEAQREQSAQQLSCRLAEHSARCAEKQKRREAVLTERRKNALQRALSLRKSLDRAEGQRKSDIEANQERENQRLLFFRLQKLNDRRRYLENKILQQRVSSSLGCNAGLLTFHGSCAPLAQQPAELSAVQDEPGEPFCPLECSAESSTLAVEARAFPLNRRRHNDVGSLSVPAPPRLLEGFRGHLSASSTKAGTSQLKPGRTLPSVLDSIAAELDAVLSGSPQDPFRHQGVDLSLLRLRPEPPDSPVCTEMFTLGASSQNSSHIPSPLLPRVPKTVVASPSFPSPSLCPGTSPEGPRVQESAAATGKRPSSAAASRKPPRTHFSGEGEAGGGRHAVVSESVGVGLRGLPAPLPYMSPASPVGRKRIASLAALALEAEEGPPSGYSSAALSSRLGPTMGSPILGSPPLGVGPWTPRAG
eukprot:RCo049675